MKKKSFRLVCVGVCLSVSVRPSSSLRSRELMIWIFVFGGLHGGPLELNVQGRELKDE